MINKKRILILGASGQLGSDVLCTLQKKDFARLLALTRDDLNLENLKALKNSLKLFAPFDYIVNCSSFTNTADCEKNEGQAFLINSEVPKLLAQICKEFGATLIHVSTDYVFDGKTEGSYLETDQVNPLSIYGKSKAQGEINVMENNPKSFIFRVASLYGVKGSKGKGGNFVETMLAKAKLGQALKVIDDQVMSPTHTLDVARVIAYFIENAPQDYGIYHCVNQGEGSWFEFTQEILKQLNLETKMIPIKMSDYDTSVKRPKRSVLSVEKLSKYYQMPKWEDALHEYLRLKRYI